MTNKNLPNDWLEFVRRGKLAKRHQTNSVQRCLGSDGIVRGYYSGLPLNPLLPPTHSMYPSHDHNTHPKNHAEMVVEAQIFNDSKSHFSGPEFWQSIEHLYAVGVATGQCSANPRLLNNHWSPKRHYGKNGGL